MRRHPGDLLDDVMKLVWMLSAALLLVACGPGPSVVEREGEPAVLVYPPGDDSMHQATRDARASVQSFISEIPSLAAEGSYISVKAPLSAGDDTEHVWLSDATFRDGLFRGAIGNEPISPQYRLGDPHEVDPAEISDWMAVRDGLLYGGFTIFVARDELSADQRAAFEQSLGFRMPPTPKRF